jgi:hypothetical protein
MKALQVIFTSYLAILLAWYVPAHQRGQIVLGEKSAQTGLATMSAAHGCCEVPAKPAQPSDSDRKACFICFWVTGLVSVEPWTMQLQFVERLYEAATVYHAQVHAVALRLNHFGRDPPAC